MALLPSLLLEAYIEIKQSQRASLFARTRCTAELATLGREMRTHASIVPRFFSDLGCAAVYKQCEGAASSPTSATSGSCFSASYWQSGLGPGLSDPQFGVLSPRGSSWNLGKDVGKIQHAADWWERPDVALALLRKVTPHSPPDDRLGEPAPAAPS